MHHVINLKEKKKKKHDKKDISLPSQKYTNIYIYIYIYIYIHKLCVSCANVKKYKKPRHLLTTKKLYFGFSQTFKNSIN